MSDGPNRRGRKVACPSCGAELIIAGRSGQRVKCPKCTAVMPTAESQPPATSASVEQQLAALHGELQQLQARVALLEKVSRPHSAETCEQHPQPAPGKLHWVSLPEQSQTSSGLVLPDRVHETALVHNLRILSGNQILIRSAAGNDAARRLAERFKELFTEAEWGVNGVIDLPVSRRERGLALAAGALPPTRETTRTYLAFTAAGFALESRLDPSLQSDETMLIVA